MNFGLARISFWPFQPFSLKKSPLGVTPLPLNPLPLSLKSHFALSPLGSSGGLRSENCRDLLVALQPIGSYWATVPNKG